jgi:hypothetical protein
VKWLLTDGNFDAGYEFSDHAIKKSTAAMSLATKKTNTEAGQKQATDLIEASAAASAAASRRHQNHLQKKDVCALGERYVL